MAQQEVRVDCYEIRPAEGENRTFEDPLEAAKCWRSFRLPWRSAELLINGRAPTAEHVAIINRALEQLNDELPKFLVFKHEYECDGMPEGPVWVGPDPEQIVLYGEAAIMGEPWSPPCRCEEPGGEDGDTCKECGGQVRKWLTLHAAEVKAAELGLELREGG